MVFIQYLIPRSPSISEKRRPWAQGATGDSSSTVAPVSAAAHKSRSGAVSVPAFGLLVEGFYNPMVQLHAAGDGAGAVSPPAGSRTAFVFRRLPLSPECFLEIPLG